MEDADFRSEAVGVLLFDGFSNQCLASAVEPLRAANTLSGRLLFRWDYLTIDGGAATSSSGIRIGATCPLHAFPRGDVLLVVAGYDVVRAATHPVPAGLRAAAQRFNHLVGIDTGAWILATSGLLDGRRATVHWDEFGAMQEAFPNVRMEPRPWVMDGAIATSGGAATAMDLVLTMIEARHGAWLRYRIAALFQGGESGRPDPALRMDDQAVGRAIGVMQRHLETVLPIPEIARCVGIGAKSLERRFKLSTGLTPGAFYRRMRLEAAHRLLETGRLSVVEVAQRCGYDDANSLGRAHKAHFGETCRSVLRRRNG